MWEHGGIDDEVDGRGVLLLLSILALLPVAAEAAASAVGEGGRMCALEEGEDKLVRRGGGRVAVRAGAEDEEVEGEDEGEEGEEVEDVERSGGGRWGSRCEIGRAHV